MLRIILVVYILVLPLFVFGQKKSSAMGKVTYLHQTKLLGNNELNGDAVLFFGKKKSVYIHKATPTESRVKDEGVLIDVVTGDEEGFPIFKNLQKNEVIYKTTFGLVKKRCVITDKLPSIAWEIQKESKKIGKYECQKAVGEFAGRTYDVWFTTKIPIRTGPHKLAGLPGLILEATSRDGRVQFLFKSLELSTNLDYKITPPSEKMKYNSKEEYESALLKYNQNLLKIAKSEGIELKINTPHPESKIEKE